VYGEDNMSDEPTSVEEYRKLSRKVIRCPECGRVAEIQKVNVSAMYPVYMELEGAIPDVEKLKEEEQKEIVKVNTIIAIMLVGMVKPKVTQEPTEKSLGLKELDDCCGKFYLPEIIDFSGMSPKAENARMSFAKTQPVQTIGLAAMLSRSRPSEYMDPTHTMTDYERASLDSAVIIEAQKNVEKVSPKPGLDSELDQKYSLWDERAKLWA